MQIRILGPQFERTCAELAEWRASLAPDDQPNISDDLLRRALTMTGELAAVTELSQTLFNYVMARDVSEAATLAFLDCAVMMVATCSIRNEVIPEQLVALFAVIVSRQEQNRPRNMYARARAMIFMASDPKASINATANDARVSRQAVMDWRKEPEFMRAVAAVRNDPERLARARSNLAAD